MHDTKIKIPIRSALIPNYYKNFHCLMGECRDNCCMDGWNISFSKKEYLRLRRMDVSPEMKAQLQTTVRRNRTGDTSGNRYGRLQQEGKRCPFLGEDKLCAIQRTCGHKVLPSVCLNYPRREQYTGAAKEYSLSLSCEGVLEQLWNLPDGIEFVEEPLPKTEWQTENIAPENRLLAFFAPIRELCIDILQQRTMTLSQRMLYLGMVMQRLQQEDWDQLDPEVWVEHQQRMLVAAQIDNIEFPGGLDMFLLRNANVMQLQIHRFLEIAEAMEIRYSIQISQARGDQAEVQTNFRKQNYIDAYAKYQEAFADREYFFENVMVALMMYSAFPRLQDKEAIWKSYVSLCNIYSFYRFISVCGCGKEASKAQLFHGIAMASRMILHNQDHHESIREELFRNESASLAHLAILLFGWEVPQS